MKQSSFNVIRKDETQKWERLKSFLIKLERAFDEGRIVNNIDNQVLLQKILHKMDIYEDQERL